MVMRVSGARRGVKCSDALEQINLVDELLAQEVVLGEGVVVVHV
jgi:hypothetical protein